MPNVDFAAYPYYPALQCSFPELHGYRLLDDADKDNLLPIFEISQRTYDDKDLVGSLNEIKGTVANRPFILDLCKDPCPPPFIPKKQLTSSESAKIEEQKKTQQSYNVALAQILNPTDGFKAWRGLVELLPNCIPVLQFTDATNQSKDIIRQGSMLAREGSIAVRIHAETDPEIYTAIALLIATLDTASSLLIIIDCGQGRTRIAERAEAARKAIATILSEVDVLQRPNVRAVCLSNSFPNATHDGLKDYPNLDLDLFEEASEAFPFMYGDYAAVYRRKNTSMFMPGDWRATVITPSKGGWLIYRHPDAKDQEGWKTGSTAAQKHVDFVPLDTWGASVLARAANGDIEESKSPRFWYAAKVNLHIHRQLNRPGGEDADYDFG